MKKISFEQGRSMIEMLSVIVIVGLLSIGGISGFNTLLVKYNASGIEKEVIMQATTFAAQMNKFGSGHQKTVIIRNNIPVVFEKLAKLSSDDPDFVAIFTVPSEKICNQIEADFPPKISDSVLCTVKKVQIDFTTDAIAAD